MSKPGVMHIWGPLRSSMTKVTLLNGTDRCLSDWLNLFDWATGCLRLHKSFKGRRFCKCEKKREEKRKREKSPHSSSTAIDTQTCTHTHAPERLLEGLFIRFKHLIHCPTTQALSGHQPLTKNREPGKSVDCQCHWLGAELWADDEASLKPTVEE